MAEDVACRSCFFWVREPEGRYGECRRDAPVTTAKGQGYAAWPRTLPLDWRGEHARPQAGELPRLAREDRG